MENVNVGKTYQYAHVKLSGIISESSLDLMPAFADAAKSFCFSITFSDGIHVTSSSSTS